MDRGNSEEVEDDEMEEEEEEEEEEEDVEAVPERCKLKTCFAKEEMYHVAHAASVADPASFWGRVAADLLPWHTPFATSCCTPPSCDFSGDLPQWFAGGTLNACYACVDRWALAHPLTTALVWEGDDPESARRVTFSELLESCKRLANVLRTLRLRPGDVAAIFMPTCPEAVLALLACARIGVVHCAVFVGFSPAALAARINDCKARVLITVDATVRGTRPIFVKKAADEAATLCPGLEHMLVFRQSRWLGAIGRQAASVLPCAMHPTRDIWAEEAMMAQSNVCEPAWVPGNHPLFILYTSGSTGAPKGIVHSTAGFLVYVAASARLAFDVSHGDVFACAADIGWIASHSYSVYGVLGLGVTSVLVASLPLYPTPSRWWEIIDRHAVTHFWSTPSALRVLAKHGDAPAAHAKFESLRLLGSIGEPIDPQTWKWYFRVVGRGRCGIVDSYWLTETGGVLICPFPGCTKLKPGCCTRPFLGIDCAILDPITFAELPGNSVEGVLAIRKPWPGLAIGIAGKPKLLQETYIRNGYFVTGDGAVRDDHGRYAITGRMDDVIKIDDQRLGTAEIESVLMSHPAVAEAAVIGAAQSTQSGQTVIAYVTLRFEFTESLELIESLKQQVSNAIGPAAVPSTIVVTRQLPRTRAGKIVRRLLRKVAEKQTTTEQLGDISTIADASVLQEIIAKAQSTL